MGEDVFVSVPLAIWIDGEDGEEGEYAFPVDE